MADKDLTLYTFQGIEIRVIMRQGEPWFVAKDVGEALGYAWNGSGTIRHVPEEWKGVGSVPTTSGEVEMAVLSEQGLYFFLGRSDKPGALPFQIWLAGEVLPDIRKHGMYVKDELLDNPDLLYDVVGRYREERRRRQAEEVARIAAEAKVAEMTPKANFADACYAATNSILVRQLAKMAKKLGIDTGERRLYQTLRDWGYVIKGKTEPTQRAVEMGILEMIERPIPVGESGTKLRFTTKVTPKGQEHIINRLLNNAA